MTRSQKVALDLLISKYQSKVIYEAHLQKGVLVMLTHNMNVRRGLYNGRIGMIVGFCPRTANPIVQWQASGGSGGGGGGGGGGVGGVGAGDIHNIIRECCENANPDIDDTASRLAQHNMYRLERKTWSVAYSDGKLFFSHFPIRYAWATTIHKYQGRTADDLLRVDLSYIATWGQAYSACSRVKSWNQLQIVGMLKPDSKFCHPAVLEFMTRIDRQKELKRDSNKTLSTPIPRRLQRQQTLLRDIIAGC